MSSVAFHRAQRQKCWGQYQACMCNGPSITPEKKLLITLNGPSVPPETCCLWRQTGRSMLPKNTVNVTDGQTILPGNAADGLIWAHYCCQVILLIVTNGPTVSSKSCCRYLCMGPSLLPNMLPMAMGGPTFCYITVGTLSRLGIVLPIGNVALRVSVLGSK